MAARFFVAEGALADQRRWKWVSLELLRFQGCRREAGPSNLSTC